MSILYNKKFQINKSFATGIFAIIAPVMVSNLEANASTSLMVSGHAGVVGQATYGSPPVGSDFSAIRVPIGLILEAKPTDNFS